MSEEFGAPAASGYPPAVPPSYGVATGQRTCYACRRPVFDTAVVCPSCGSALAAPKSKGVAVLLAVFLSFWTWVYTYRRDSTKFWVGLVLTVLGAILMIVLIGWLVIFATWLWAVIDTATKDERYYNEFPNR